jgi:hypothetical protein
MVNRIVSVVAAAAFVGFVGPAGAQVAITATTPTPTYEISVGYQLFRAGEVCGEDQIVGGEVVQTCRPDRVFPLGFAVDVARNFGTLGLGVVGDFGWSHDSEDELSVTSWHLAGGLRWSGRKTGLSPFGQFLLGGVFNSFSDDVGTDFEGDNHFMLQPGGGVVFAAESGWGFVGQVDLRHVFLDEETSLASSRNDLRVFLGIRIALR